jgi:methionyl aminopeptidase
MVGFLGDSSRLFFVGEPTVKAERLCRLTRDAMWRGIECVKAGAHLGDIGDAIHALARENRYSVVREYCGHGIGRVFHEDPQVLHYSTGRQGIELLEGMTFTIEPMLNAGKREVKLAKDGWTVTTKDRDLSAQWEHTLLVTSDGFEVLTLGAGDRT